jgi:hypothetical protein
VLKQIKEKRVLLILEDYFIYKTVNNTLIDRLLSIAEENNAAYFKIASFPSKYNVLWPYKNYNSYDDIGEILPEAKYRIDTQIAIWNKSVLEQLLVKTESPWQFEINASVRSRKINMPFLILKEKKNIKYVHGPITYYCTAVSSGIWMRGAIELCKKEKIEADFTKRKTETYFECKYRSFYISLPIFLRKSLDFLYCKFSRKGKPDKYSQ